jgi:hypothetical protein
MKNSGFSMRQNEAFDVELDTFLHPAMAFEHPRDVVNDPDLTLKEKRADPCVLGTEACAVAPALRCVPGTGRPLPVDETLEALRALDKQADATDTARYRRSVRRRSIEIFRSHRAKDRADTSAVALTTYATHTARDWPSGSFAAGGNSHDDHLQ